MKLILLLLAVLALTGCDELMRIVSPCTVSLGWGCYSPHDACYGYGCDERDKKASTPDNTKTER